MHELLIFVAKYLYLVVGLAAFLYWLAVSKQEKLRLVMFGLIAAIATFIFVKIGAALFYDPRPFVTNDLRPLYPHGADNGFPSDHTALTAFIALTMFSSSKRLGSILLILSILIGASRVIGHIHSPIDIVGSLVFALSGYGVAVWASPLIMSHYRRATDEHVPSN